MSTSSAVLDTERALVGALMTARTVEEAAALLETAGDLKPSHFRERAAAETFRIGSEIIRRGAVPDPVSVVRALSAIGRGNAGAYVGALIDGLPRPHSLAPWAEAIRADVAARGNGEREGSVWARAIPAPAFVNTNEGEAEWVERPFLAPGAVTLWFSPRGLGKTLAAHDLAVRLARAGKRVLLVDRDNPRAETRRRLRQWGAVEAPTLRVLNRDDAPPLTDAEAWRIFPLREYDVVIIDSIDASTEGAGEQDSSRPSKAMACVLDIAHAAGGPAFLVLGNTIKSGSHGRGSGVVEDRADIVFEIRDCTDFTPSGRKPWWEELPPAGRADWGPRATRRKGRSIYRLGFIPSKFRLAGEPEPLVLEVDLRGETWLVRDVTAALAEAGQEALAAAARETEQRLTDAEARLGREVWRAAGTGKPLLRTAAEQFLVDGELKRKEAREVLQQGEGRAWTFRSVQGRGNPVELLPVGFDGSEKTDPAAEIPPLAGPRQLRAEEAPISAGLAGRGRQKSTPSGPASMAGETAPLFPPPSPFIEGVQDSFGAATASPQGEDL